MKKANSKMNNKMVLAVIILFIIPVPYYYFYYYYSVFKRKKINVKERMRVLNELYSMVTDISNEINVKSFLLYGSLLGQQRNNQLICYDFDIDMGIISTDFNKLYTALKNKINTTKYSIEYNDNFCYGKKIQIIDKNTTLNLDIDIFEKQPNGSFKRDLNYVCFLFLKYMLNQCNKRDIPHDWLFPLKPVSFLGKNVYIPNNPNAFLECEYGKEYLTPDHKCNKDCSKCVKNY